MSRITKMDLQPTRRGARPDCAKGLQERTTSVGRPHGSTPSGGIGRHRAIEHQVHRFQPDVAGNSIPRSAILRPCPCPHTPVWRGVISLTRATFATRSPPRRALARRPEHDAGDPRRGVRPLAAAPGRVQLRADRVGPLAHRHQAARDHPAGRAELRGRGLPGHVAELELRHRLQRPRRADAAPPALQRRRAERSILYRASLTEMVVPYGDPAPTQRRQERLRRRRVRHGHVRQQPGARLRLPRPDPLLRRHLVDSRGEPLTIKNAICMHEEDFGILWKHTDRRLPDTPEVRRSRRLVISSISTVENYEYGFFWYLYQDGTIQFEVKLTGFLPRRRPPGREAEARRARRAAALRADPSALLQRAARLRPRRRAQLGLRGAGRADPPGPDNPYGNAFSAGATLLKTSRGEAAVEPLSARTGRSSTRPC